MGVLRLRSSISLSVTVHVLLLMAWAVLIGQQAAKTVPPKVTWIEVDPLSPEAKRRLQEKNKNRIVESEQGKKTDEADPKAYLGKQTQSVDREMVNQHPSVQSGLGKSHTQNRAEENSRSQAKEQSKKSDQKVAKNARQARENDLSKFGLPILPSLTKPSEPKPQQNTGVYADNRVGDGAAPQDYIKGLKEGESTALNTKEYMFYGYFQRIRERLDQAWTGILREQLSKIFRSGRQLASDRDLTTKVLVTMNKGGEIVRVQVLEESGTMDLDDAAVRAFNKAGPFPNPPQGMMDQGGRVEIRWDFVLRT